ncbi:PLP-dependent aminotransferase family protein [Longispora albida]|uniref:aminotransferase-like domain-containing protein n=1 Tax=Longispora albida TaxID=203523 RepID=UPI00037164D5|nr:PLP-dependent aminotransferase family protein [Longispora albida]
MDIIREQLHASVSDPVSSSMNFLNEVAERFPSAISLAAGRPFSAFFDPDDITKYISLYRQHLADSGQSPESIRDALMQYGRTNGQIHGIIAQLLATDENVHVAPEAIAVTAGCQEAMVIVLRGLCAGPEDVLLAASPCYVGITGAARLLGIEVVPVPEGSGGLDPAEVTRVAAEVRRAGKRPKALYMVPNFSNPSGVSLPVATRQALLDAAAEAGLLILEDDPYGLFGLSADPAPSLKSLDTDRRVIYLGSFAKSVFPGARVGFLVADQQVVDSAGRRTTLAAELSAIKSMLTVNTSPISQAVIGGFLVESGYSLRAANADKIAFYQQNLRTLLSALDTHLGAIPGVSWNVPDGGFFAVVDVPVRADEAFLERSASKHGVLWTPMSFFYTDGGGSSSLRLSCSWPRPEEITEGVRRLAQSLVDEMRDV